ncbi:MAG TPA: pyruvate kinase [Thioalkalivibrio sp.]|nr:pyruvate kinase [Thioalkalivibrio sp.]
MGETHQHIPSGTPELEALLGELQALRTHLDQRSVERLAPYVDILDLPGSRESACNLAQYLALREFDRRPLQQALARNGLSSLGRSEAHVLGTIDQVIHLLARALDRDPRLVRPACPTVGFEQGSDRLAANAERVLGSADRGVRIMVTLSNYAAEEPAHVRELLLAGMDCARINCAHDTPELRQRMVRNVREQANALGRPCQIVMDLAGPKLRTGPLESYTRPLHIRPHRDVRGVIRRPATILLCAPEIDEGGLVPDTDARLGLPAGLGAGLRVGDRLVFEDTRAKQRAITIERELGPGRWLGSCGKSCYIDAGTRVRLERRAQGRKANHEGSFHFTGFTLEPVELRMYRDDPLLLRRDQAPGHPARVDASGHVTTPATIGCMGELALPPVAPGDPVWFDDGTIGAQVLEVREEGMLLRITQAKPGGSLIRSDKGINFPQNPMHGCSLTPKDLADLDLIARDADAVGYSFVESADDMRLLMQELAQRDATGLPIIAKIETRQAVRNLPEIILSTIGQHPLGIMIARGDLAVELGPERLAEMQEEILWICEAAHIPVVWATQVLETLVKKGTVSRPELTDAAMSNRAECVMLNKGPYVTHAVQTLSDILARMHDHQVKKTAQLRALHW